MTCLERLRTLLRVATAGPTLIVIAAASTGTPVTGRAQTITLPTVRAFGATPEQAMMYRLIATVRATYEADIEAAKASGAATATIEAAGRGRTTLPRLSLVTLSAVTQTQLDALWYAASTLDSLRALAGDEFVPGDKTPRMLLDATKAVGSNDQACGQLTEPEVDRVREETRATIKRASASSLTPQIVRTALATPPDEVVERAVRTRCAVTEVKEREPARQFSALRQEEAESGRVTLVANLDTLSRIATAVIIRRKLATRHWFPVRGREQAAAFWQQSSFAPLNVTGISGSTKNGTAFTEILSPIVQALRMSVNVVLAAEQSDPAAAPAPATQSAALPAPSTGPPATRLADGDAAQKNLQRFLNGGGLVNISVTAPALHVASSSGGTAAVVLLSSRLGGNAPVLGAKAGENPTVSVEIGTELHARLIDRQSGAGFFLQLRTALAHGTSDYLNSIGITNNRPIGYGTALLGINFDRQYVVTVSKPIAGPLSFRRSPFQVGLTLVRGGQSP